MTQGCPWRPSYGEAFVCLPCLTTICCFPLRPRKLKFYKVIKAQLLRNKEQSNPLGRKALAYNQANFIHWWSLHENWAPERGSDLPKSLTSHWPSPCRRENLGFTCCPSKHPGQVLSGVIYWLMDDYCLTDQSLPCCPCVRWMDFLTKTHSQVIGLVPSDGKNKCREFRKNSWILAQGEKSSLRMLVHTDMAHLTHLPSVQWG